ncbi:hypothetical protein GJ496_008595 [Pomphorhynchus laevis]|nr:hypothetical protein GJ496_008595 [Pomphorhynchus laevis]
MSIRLDCSHQRISEKLVIYNERAIGILTRLHYLKNASLDERWNVTSLANLKWDSLLKSIRKKFPAVDKLNVKSLSSIKPKILKTLSPYYYTMVDLLEFRDHFYDLLNIMTALSLRFFQAHNADLLVDFCTLLYRFVCCFLLFNRLTDKRTVLGLYGACSYPSRDTTFARIGHMTVDYESFSHKINDDFLSYQPMIESALASLLALSNQDTPSEPGLLQHPLQLRSVLEMAQWFLSMCFLCPSASLLYFDANDHMKNALLSTSFLIVFREEICDIANFINSNIKGIRNKAFETLIADQKQFRSRCVKCRQDTRIRLIRQLSRLYHLINENEYFSGPMSRDVLKYLEDSKHEVNWLVSHGSLLDNENLPDRFTCELIYYMEKMKEVIIANKKIIDQYFCDYIAMFDAIELHLSIKDLTNITLEENQYISSFVDALDKLSEKKADMNEVNKLCLGDLHLDWKRFQAISTQRSSNSQSLLAPRFICIMHSISFHCDLVENSQHLFKEAGTATNLLFYPIQFESIFRSCIELPSRSSYCVACPLLCCNINQVFNKLCPEEKVHLSDMIVGFMHSFLNEISKELKNLFFLHLREVISRKERAPMLSLARFLDIPPETEEHPSIQNLDRLVFAVRQLCSSLTSNSMFECCSHTFNVFEYLILQLESRFDRSMLSMLQLDVPNEENVNVVCKPSMIRLLQNEFKNLVELLSDFAYVDCLRLCSDVLVRYQGKSELVCSEHIQNAFINWYCHTIVLLASDGRIIFSPVRRSFVLTKTSSTIAAEFDPEEYTSPFELEALIEVLGSDGVQALTSQLVRTCASEYDALLILARQNIDLLKTSELDPDSTLEWLKTLKSSQQDVVTEEFIILAAVIKHLKTIGVALQLRQLIQLSRKSVTLRRLPFLQEMSDIIQLPKQIEDLTNVAQGHSDPILSTLISQYQSIDEGVHLTKLLFSTAGLFLPAWMDHRNCIFNRDLAGHSENIHCISKAIDSLSKSLNYPTCQKFQHIFLRVLCFATIHYPFRNSSVFYSALILLDKLVEECTYLKHGMLEPMVPRGLISTAFLHFENEHI